MCTEVYRLLHVGRDKGIGTSSNSESAIGNTSAVLEVCELINSTTTLEAEMLENVEVSFLAEDGCSC